MSQPEQIPDTELLKDLVTQDGVFSVDSEQRIAYWSPSAERILGLRAKEVTGKYCFDVIGGLDSRNSRYCRRNCPIAQNASRGRAAPDYDVLYSGPDGDQRWLNISIAVWKRRKKNPQVIHFFRDVTLRRRTEEFATKASLALRELLNEGNAGVLDSTELGEAPMPKLSSRELQVLRLLATGMSTGEIADSLGIQAVTARNHITRVLNKLGVNSRLKAIVYASQHRLL